jgi:hypothetical protein
MNDPPVAPMPWLSMVRSSFEKRSQGAGDAAGGGDGAGARCAAARHPCGIHPPVLNATAPSGVTSQRAFDPAALVGRWYTASIPGECHA